MSLEIYIGPMWASKSSSLINKLTRYADIGLKVIYCNSLKDSRVTESSDLVVTTHNSGFKGLSKKIEGYKIDRLSDLNYDKYDIIGIDEGQFFADLVPVVRDLVINKNKCVIIASLDYDSSLQPFGNVHELVGLCNPGHLHKMGAICKKCGPDNITDAGFTLKISGNESIIDPGGVDKYLPVCLKCYIKYNNK